MLPRQYIAPRIDGPIALTGRLDDPVWKLAPWTDDFVDIQGDRMPRPKYRTRAKMLWDDRNLYIGAELEEPHVWATITEHDAVIFQDPDFEVFLDPDGDNHLYVEMEMNALNTTWDLLLAKPYRDGGPPIDGFEVKGMRTATQVRGTMNDPRDRDEGWSVEIVYPWEALKQIAGCPVPPRVGDGWRINFSRVEWQVEIVDGKYRKVPGKPEDNWVWSPQGVIDMHQPEHWGYLWFGESRFEPKDEEQRQALMRIYHAQKVYRQRRKRWAKDLTELELEVPGARMETTSRLFQASLGPWQVDQESRLTRSD